MAPAWPLYGQMLGRRLRRRRSFAAQSVICAILLLLAGAASADGGRGRVVLFSVAESEGGWPEAERRTMAELKSLGFEVVATAHPTASPDDVGALMREESATAAVRVVRPTWQSSTSPAVVAYATNGGAGTPLVRHISAERIVDQESAEQVALLAAELVYSALVRAGPARPPRSSEPPPVAPPTVILGDVQPARASWSLQARLGPWFGGTPEARGGLGGMALGGSLWPSKLLGLDLGLNLPAVPLRFSAAEGRATVWLADERLHGVVRTPAWQRFGVVAGLGFGGLHAVSSGRARPPLQDGADAASAVLLSSMLAGSARFSRSVRLLLAGRAAVAVPEIRLDLAGREVAALGRPFLDVGLMLTADVPRSGSGPGRAAR